MQSIQSRLINFMLRNRHFFSGKFRKEVYTMETSIEAFRLLCEKGAERYAKIPDDVVIKPFDINYIKAEWLIPNGAQAEKVILYVHGGGYVSGSCNDHRGFVSKFARQAGVKTLVYEYRLAPEHPYPAAVDDSVEVYSWLIASGYSPDNILIAGESAGGGLSLALLLAIRDKQLPRPVACVAISPWTDLSCTGESYKTKNRYSLAPLNSWTVFSKHYCGNYPPDFPGISPLFADLHGLPPLFINSGEDDELHDDGERFAEKARASGVDVTFVSGRNMVHCYPLLAPMFPEATEAMAQIIDFVNKQLKL